MTKIKIEAVEVVPDELRQRYLAGLAEPQELYVEQLVAVGQAYRLSNHDQFVGYGVVADATVVEFHVEDGELTTMPALFNALLAESGATQAACKTFDPRMLAAAASQPATTRTTGYLFRTIHNPHPLSKPDILPRFGSTVDIDLVWSMHDGFFDDRAEIAHYAADRRLFLYETAGHELVGCGILTRVIPNRDAVDVGMVVAAEHRGHGLGAYIVAHLKHHCLQVGDRPIAGCSVDNQASRRSLENAGFTSAHSLVEFVY